MTVGIAIKCSDGLVVASDSLATFGRGVPVSKSISKIHKIEHASLEYPVVVLGAGATAFVDKFLDRIRRSAIDHAVKVLERNLDVIDFAERVCEPTVMALFKEYAIDRREFLGIPCDSSIGLIIAGATRGGALRAFHIHHDGLAENIPDYGTVGSGAAYAELFLRALVDEKGQTTVADAENLAIYSVKGAEIMDPHVGGNAHVMILRIKERAAKVKAAGSNPASENASKFVLSVDAGADTDGVDDLAKVKMKEILSEMGKKMRTLVKEEPLDEVASTKKNGASRRPRNEKPVPAIG